MAPLKLVKPSKEYISSYTVACQEYIKAGLSVYADLPRKPTPAQTENLLRNYARLSLGRDIPRGWVPSTVFWMIDGNEYIGAGTVRHALTKLTKKYGGHIDYHIRPSKWGNGYGTLLLKLLLEEACKIGIKNALLTCSDKNTASIKVILKNGGEYLGYDVTNYGGSKLLTYKYRIDTGYKDGDLYYLQAPWYHGSNIEFSVLQTGSIITQCRELAEEYSHKLSVLSCSNDKGISYSGTETGFLYVLDEPIIPSENIYLDQNSSTGVVKKWLTVEPLKVKQIS